MNLVNWQWAVTESGLEAIEGSTSPSIRGETSRYAIRAERLLETAERGGRTLFDWPLHVAQKNWVDMDAFNEAFARAIEIHHEGGLAAIDGDILEDSFRHAKVEAMRGEEPGSRREEPKQSNRAGAKAGLFIRQAELRFGSVPEAARKRIRGASVLELEAWREALLTAASLEDVLASGPGRRA